MDVAGPFRKMTASSDLSRQRSVYGSRWRCERLELRVSPGPAGTTLKMGRPLGLPQVFHPLAKLGVRDGPGSAPCQPEDE